MTDTARHQRDRRWWGWTTLVILAASILLRAFVPSALWLVGTWTWLWPLVGYAYHTGWLRRDRPDAILRWLTSHPDSGAYEIAKGSGYPAGTLYPDLIRLERAELIVSRWGDQVGDWSGAPRRRLYSATSEGNPDA